MKKLINIIVILIVILFLGFTFSGDKSNSNLTAIARVHISSCTGIGYYIYGYYHQNHAEIGHCGKLDGGYYCDINMSECVSGYYDFMCQNDNCTASLNNVYYEYGSFTEYYITSNCICTGIKH